MPNLAAASVLVVVATKGRRVSPPPLAMNQSRATAALAIVSCVVKVFEAMTNRVLRGSSPRSTGVMTWPSTLDTKWNRRSWRT